MKRPIVLALGIVLTAAGCGGGGNSTSAQQSNATQQPAARHQPAAGAPAAPHAMGAARNDAVTNLPVYPGATKLPMRVNRATFCNHKVTLTIYGTSGAGADRVADWYVGRMNGAIKLNIGNQSGGRSGMTGYTLVDPSGADAASVWQMHFAPSGANHTSIGLVTYNPPLTPDEMQLMRDATGTDAAGRQRARAQLKTKCGGSAFSVGK